jgi:hypothetical protein
MFDDFAADVLATEVKQRKPKSGYLKKCRGLALLTGIRELPKDNPLGRTVIFDMMVLTVKPSDPANPNDVNVPGEAVSKWFKFEDGNAQKRAAIKADFKRQLCSIFDVNPETLTEAQYKAMAKAAEEGKCNGLLLKYEPRTTDKGLTFHDYYTVPGKNSPAEVAKRAAGIAKGDGPETFL